MHHAHLARLAGSAYHTKTHWVSNGTEATLSLDNHTQVLAFRGTSADFSDILRDLRGIPWWNGKLKSWCHRGFLTGATAFMAGTSILGDIDPSKPLILTGHSLGGALAIGVGAFLTLSYRRPTEIVTYGAPKFSYGRAVANILRDVTVVQYRNGIDIVPTVPWLGKHVAEITELTAADDDLFLNHRIQEYIDGLAP